MRTKYEYIISYEEKYSTLTIDSPSQANGQSEYIRSDRKLVATCLSIGKYIEMQEGDVPAPWSTWEEWVECWIGDKIDTLFLVASYPGGIEVGPGMWYAIVAKETCKHPNSYFVRTALYCPQCEDIVGGI